ncbi:MAG: hypothetical protein IPP60_13375 [Sphingobacteriales bacterium]|nr:hypothetical protein [Sphingobacteriales bacterium]
MPNHHVPMFQIITAISPDKMMLTERIFCKSPIETEMTDGKGNSSTTNQGPNQK